MTILNAKDSNSCNDVLIQNANDPNAIPSITDTINLCDINDASASNVNNVSSLTVNSVTKQVIMNWCYLIC